MYYVYMYYKDFTFHQIKSGEAFIATAANKNKIRTFEAEIGPQNKKIEAGQNFTGS